MCDRKRGRVALCAPVHAGTKVPLSVERARDYRYRFPRCHDVCEFVFDCCFLCSGENARVGSKPLSVCRVHVRACVRAYVRAYVYLVLICMITQ